MNCWKFGAPCKHYHPAWHANFACRSTSALCSRLGPIADPITKHFIRFSDANPKPPEDPLHYRQCSSDGYSPRGRLCNTSSVSPRGACRSPRNSPRGELQGFLRSSDSTRSCFVAQICCFPYSAPSWPSTFRAQMGWHSWKVCPRQLCDLRAAKQLCLGTCRPEPRTCFRASNSHDVSRSPAVQRQAPMDCRYLRRAQITPRLFRLPSHPHSRAASRS